jgi:alpha/beta hydrolase fold
MHRSPRPPRWLLAAACVAALLALAPGASAQSLQWQDCGGPPEVQCATRTVPLDYDRPGGRTIDIAVARMPAKDQAHRIGSLFVNPGGPGASAIDFLVGAGAEGLFAALNERFDIVAFDPRGVGHSSPSIDCKVNQETQGLYSQPFQTPFNVDPRGLLLKDLRYVQRCQALNGDILAHVSTADVARDMDVLRKAVGDDKLSYLGFSYGTFLGATYASCSRTASVRSSSTDRSMPTSSSTIPSRGPTSRPPRSSASWGGSSRRVRATRPRASGSARSPTESIPGTPTTSWSTAPMRRRFRRTVTRPIGGPSMATTSTR